MNSTLGQRLLGSLAAICFAASILVLGAIAVILLLLSAVISPFSDSLSYTCWDAAEDVLSKAGAHTL